MRNCALVSSKLQLDLSHKSVRTEVLGGPTWLVVFSCLAILKILCYLLALIGFKFDETGGGVDV